jgi:hypothetical protein
MEIRKHELVLERLSEHVVHEPLDPAHVLEDVPVCTVDLGFERDRGEQAVGDGELLWVGAALGVSMGVMMVVAGTERGEGGGAGRTFELSCSGVADWLAE